MSSLKSFEEVVADLATKYGIQEEVVEALLVEWLGILYYAATGRDPGVQDDLLRFEL